MNKTEYINLIKNPENISSDKLEELASIAKQFPYSGIAQMIYAKALHLNDDIGFQEQLKTTAIVSSDRKKIYHLIHQSKLRELIAEIEEETSTILEEPKPEKIIKESSETVVSENFEKTDEPVKEPVIKIDEKTDENDLDELEKNIISEAITSSILLEVPEFVESEKKSSTEADDTEQEIESEYQNEETEETKTKFSNWFAKPTDKREPTIKEKPQDTVSLIDNFLQKNTPKQENQEFFSPTNLAKVSSVDNEEFVTETLATVYASQGNYEKAIRIYERLSLKNPEKSTFFASRIRFLKEKLDNKNE